jgi:hypothetical protein
MYVRQWKQYVRGVDSSFDERKWNFTTIMEFLRVVQREGLFRLERDRRGQIRVFPGAALQRSAAPVQMPADVEPYEVPDIVEAETVDRQDETIHAEPIDEQVQAAEVIGETVEIEESEPAPVKTRRARKGSNAGRPAPRKSTGAKTPRRRKTLVPA